MILAGIGCLSPKVTHYSLKTNEQRLKNNLNILEESWLIVVVRSETYRYRTTQYHNNKVKNKRFKFRDLLLRKLEVKDNKQSKGKLSPK